MPLRTLALAIALGLSLYVDSLGRAAWVRSDETAVAGRLEALLINGGGTAAGNYQSHLLHVQQLVDVLRNAGVPDRRITILSGDGPDPAADLALREPQPEPEFWLVTGTRLEKPLKTPIAYENSVVPGFALRAATRAEVDRWFAKQGTRLRRGDTLLLYVTDHGTKNGADTRDNRITLWGKGESLSVGELRARLARLDPAVRVMMLMSQCYSGSFANLIRPVATSLPAGDLCGYFSTTRERPAYGCYPENRGIDNVGHSFDFIQELAASGSFSGAHLTVLRNDTTPDAPLRSSDLYLEELLQKAAAQGQGYEAYVDRLLASAWRDKSTWEPEIRLLDAIGGNFGCFSPRSLAELADQVRRLSGVSTQLGTHAKAWKTTLGDANRNNLERFLSKSREWKEKLSEDKLQTLSPEEARALAGPFLADLAEDTRLDADTDARLGTLRRRSETAATVAYRMEVRLGVVVRMRTLLTSIAGQVYLAREGTPGERDAYKALVACEGLRLPVDGRTAAVAARPPFPPLEDDLEAAREVLPAWMGIRFVETSAKLRTALGLLAGAASVTAIYPGSPAEEAGLEAGDIITGPPGSPFRDPRQIREWTMLATVDRPAPLELLRGEDRLEVTLVPRAYPVEWPQLPGPPRVSSAAPSLRPLQLGAYRGELPEDLRGGKPHLLFFWATWCGPCKASLPELLAFERARGTPVVAVTDEPAETLDAFFERFDKPFPERVAVDEFRRAFLAYGVSGTPTFVLVDGDGVIRSYSIGYSPGKGLGAEGWTWSEPPASPVRR